MEHLCQFTATPTCCSAPPDLLDLLITEFLFEPAVGFTIGFCWIHAAAATGLVNGAFPSTSPSASSPFLVSW